MKRFHLILSLLSVNIILLSFNRLTPITQSYLAPFDYLRLMDFLAMLPIPLMSILLYYLLKKEIINNNSFRTTGLYTFLELILITGIFLFAAGSGTHEVTNYLNTRFCEAGGATTPICKIIIYNDDDFSHFVYYAGFILLNIALMLLEYRAPRSKPVKKKDIWLISINSLVIALGIFANLAFEKIGIDLWIFGSVMCLSLYLLFSDKHKPATLPVTIYFAVSYTVGVVATILYKSLLR